MEESAIPFVKTACLFFFGSMLYGKVAAVVEKKLPCKDCACESANNNNNNNNKKGKRIHHFIQIGLYSLVFGSFGSLHNDNSALGPFTIVVDDSKRIPARD